LVLVLNSGSASVKFALIDPAPGQRVLGGEIEKVGTPDAVLHLQRQGSPPVTEHLTDGSYQAAISRILTYLPKSAPAPAPVPASASAPAPASASASIDRRRAVSWIG
jgi:acetate kinase